MIGKFKVILGFSLFYMVGLLLLTFSAIPISYHSNGDPVYSSFALSAFITSITIIGIGTGK
jgi:dipeptide/tripeptide permease